MQIVIKSHPTQQPFKKWSYLQRIRLIKIYNEYLQDHSHQGKRNDLANKSTCVHNEDGELVKNSTCVHNDDMDFMTDLTCVHNGSKPDSKPKRTKNRDIIAQQLDISSTTFERYRRIAKLDDDAINILAKGLDEGRLNFVAAYRVAQLKPSEKNFIIGLMENNTEIEIKDMDLKPLYEKSKNSKNDLSAEMIKAALLPSGTGA